MANEPDLQPGQSSEWVNYLQRLLNQHYQQSVVAENGEFDDTTANAVRHFRQQNGLGDGSNVDSHMWAKLTGETSQSSSSTASASTPEASGHQSSTHQSSGQAQQQHQQHAAAQPAHQAAGHRTPPTGGGSGPTGLLTESSIHGYVDHTYGATVSSMSADDRMHTMMQAVNEILRQGGAPDVSAQFGLSGSGNYGQFDAEQWMMTLNEHYFESSGTDADQMQNDYREALLTVYHEARHAEQAFLMARERAGLGATVDQIIQAMSANPHAAPVPARWVVEQAAQDPILQCDYTQYQTEQWYESMYGSGADHRDQVLGNQSAPDFQQQYHQLPEEADAWNADDRTRERYNQYGQ